MASTSSTGSSLINEAKEQTHYVTRGSTPRTSISSPVTSGNDLFEDQRHRKNSYVRFANLIPGEEGQSPSLPMPKDGQSLPSEEDDRGKIQSQPQFESLDDRVNWLETRLQSLEFHRPSDFSEKGDDSSELTALSTEPQWMTWQDYVGPTAKATNILEVLYEKPHTNIRRKSSVTQPSSEIVLKAAEKQVLNGAKNIERIRIRSVHITSALQSISEQTFPSLSCFTIHRPFKILIVYEDAIREYLAELESNFKQGTQCALGEGCKALINLSETFPSAKHGQQNNPDQKAASADTVEEGTDKENTNKLNCEHEISEDLLLQKEAIVHLSALVAFMKNDMREIYAKHRLLRSSKAETIAFTDLWHLFMAGDLVVTNDESNPKTPKFYKVSIIPVCALFSSRRPVKSMKLRSDGSHREVESVYEEESIRILNVDLFSFDFEGQNFGPVETRIRVVSYAREKKIKDLPLYPLRFRKDAARFKDEMFGRGAKFCELSRIAHREYNGLSVTEPQEQVTNAECSSYS